MIFNPKVILSFAAGYVLGARAGRERYEQILGWWNDLMGNPRVRQAADRGRQLASQARSRGMRTVQPGEGSTGGQTVRDVMTPYPMTVQETTSLIETAGIMRTADVGAVIVLNDAGEVTGIITDRDVAIRAVAEGMPLGTTTVADIASRDLTVLSPNAPVEEAVNLMRQKAVRRLPVVEEGRPLGIVSIGDLAIEREPESPLADISAAPPTR